MVALSQQGESFQRATWAWRNPQIETFPPAVRSAILARLEDHDATDYVEGNRFCRRLTRELERSKVGKAFDEQELRACADNYALTCQRIQAADPYDPLAFRRLRGLHPRQRLLAICDGPVTWLHPYGNRYRWVTALEPPDIHQVELRRFAAKVAFARTVGLEELPASKYMSLSGMSARLDDPLWWRRQLRKRWSRLSEQALRELGLVRRGRECYASESAVRMRRDQRRRIRQYIESSIAVNELGESLNLEAVVASSVSNPAIRRGELMTRTRGFETIAEQLGYEAQFFTFTCPSHFHAELHHGARNPRYSGATVREAQEWLCKVWSRARAQLARINTSYFGVRVAEPHHDGTPHWHALLWCRRDQLVVMSDVIHGCWLQEFGSDPGAWEKRVSCVRIEKGRGSATGYLAKYIAKNIDAAGLIKQELASETGVGGAAIHDLGLAVDAALARVDAWAAVHGIRQFQQLGGPPVGIYRELRRLRQPVGDPDIERARSCADRGSWNGYCLNSGFRFNLDAADRRLARLWRKEGRPRLPRTSVRLLLEETGRRNRYGELAPTQILGITNTSAREITREHRWMIVRKGLGEGCSTQPDISADAGMLPPPIFRGDAALGPVAITVRGSEQRIDPAIQRLQALQTMIGQMACQKSVAPTPKPSLRWEYEGGSGRLILRAVRGEPTGPPH